MRKWHNKFLTMLLVADLMASSLQPYAVAAAIGPEETIEIQESNVEQEGTDEEAQQQDTTASEDAESKEDTESKAEDTTDVESNSDNETAVEDTTTTEAATEDTDSTAEDKKEESSSETTEQNTQNVENKVAQIGETSYTTFEEAINAAQANDTIVLLQDVEVSATITVNKNLVIVSATEEARTIRRADNFKGSFFNVTNGVKLSLGDEYGTQPVIVDGGAQWVVKKLESEVTEEETVVRTLEEKQTSDDGTEETMVEVSATPTTEGAYNTGIQAEAPVVQITKGQVAVNKNTVIQNNDNTKDNTNGGAIANPAGGNGTVFVYGSILNNATTGNNTNGGAIYNNGYANVYEGAVISGNKANTNGGAIYNYGGGIVTIQDGTFTNNAAVNGGAIWADGKVDLADGTFKDNVASNNGGAVYVYSIYESRSVNFRGGLFTENKAVKGEDVFLYQNFATFSGNVQIDDVWVKSEQSLKITNAIRGKIGVTYENPEGENIQVASGNNYTLKESDVSNITSNIEMYNTAFKDGKAVLVYAPVVIDSQTHTETSDIENEVKLSVTAHAKSNETVTYQWYESSEASGENGTEIQDATESTYTVKKDKAGLYYYYCVVKAEKAAETKSEVITVKMTDKNTAEIPAITSQPVGGTYDLQKQVTLKVEASVEDSGVLSYQWYRATNENLEGAEAIKDATDATYTFTASKTGTFYYYCVVTNTKEGLKTPVSTAQSAAAQVKVNGVAVRYNGVEYSSINEVLDVLGTEDATLEVSSDIVLDKTITIDSANLTIKGENNASVSIRLASTFKNQAFVVNGGTLTLENVKVDGGAVWYGATNEYLGRGISNAGRKANAALVTINGGTVNLKEGAYLQNNVVDWAVSGVNMTAGTLNIDGGHIINNYGGSHGGAIFAASNKSTINMTAGEVSGNQARTSTGGICADTGTILNISGGQIFNNYTTGRSGGVFINGKLTLSGDAKIYHNYAGGNGGGIFQNDGTATIEGGIIEDNYANENGGAIASAKGTLNIQGGTIKGNTAKANGQGIYTESSVTIGTELNLDGISDDIYTQKTYTLTLDGNGVDNPESQTIRYLGNYNLPTLKRNGYKFLGWYTAADETGTKVENGSFITETKNVKLYAQWELTATNAITLTKQPEGGIFYIEDKKELSIDATTKEEAEVSYQWYRCDDEKGTNKVALEGETNKTLSLPEDLGTYYYFCIVSEENSVDAVSDIVKVQMISKNVASTPEFSKQPQSVEKYVGEKVVFEVEANTIDNGTLTYQWYRSQENVADIETAEKIDGATSTTYEVTPSESGVYYYFVAVTNTIKNQKGEDTTTTVTSNVARLTSHGKITVADIKADDAYMQKTYWNSYRIDTKESKDGYIETATSLYGNWGSNTIDKAFDGNWNTFWETNRSSTDNSMEITFNKEVQLDRILYATRQDAQKGQGYPTKLVVYSKTTDGEYVEVGVAESTGTSEYRIFTLPHAITSKAIKLKFEQTTSNNWPSASEIVLLRSEDTVLSGCATVYGTAIPGAQLSVSTDVQVGDKDTLAYQWQESKDGTSYTDIQGATNATYTVRTEDADANKYLRVVVSDASGKFAGTMVSEPYRSLVDVKLEGNPVSGETLKPVMNYVSGDTKYEYQWERSTDGKEFKNIEGATKETYKVDNVVANQYVRLAVKISVDGVSATTVYSDGVHIDATAMMTGAPQVGSTLRASVKGIEEKENSATYTWEIGDSETGEFKAITDATGATYTIKEDDLNKFIRVKAELTESKATVTSEAWQVKEDGTYDKIEGDSVYLSDIKKEKLIDSSIGYKTLMYDANTSGDTITLLVNGEKNYFFKGLGAHAPSTLVYDLSDYVTYYHFDRFLAYLGLDNAQGDKGNGVKFTVQTSIDNKTWKTVQTTGVLKGNTDAVKVDIQLEDAKYLKISISDNGSNANDHSVIADAVLANQAYTGKVQNQEFVKTVAEYDKELKQIREVNPDKTVKEILQMDDYKKLLYQRTFVSNATYNLVKAYAENEEYADTLKWFMNDLEALEDYALGGALSCNYTNFIKVLTKLYTKHGEDLKDTTYGSLYKRMMIAISFTHSGDVPFWADYSQKSDPVRRYEIYKKLHSKGLLINNAFENLTVTEMRWVVNAMIDDEEIEWLNYYVRTHSSKNTMKPEDFNSNNFTPGPYYFIKYGFGYNYKNEKYYTEENKEKWQKKYGLTNEAAGEGGKDFDLNVTYGTDPKIWMVFEEGAVCGGISKTGTNIVQVFGLPAIVVGQPGHAAYLQLTYTNPNDPKNSTGKWLVQNDIYGWSKSQSGGLLNGWGNEYAAELGVSSYTLLAQATLDDEENLHTAERFVKLASAYSDDPEEQIRLYEQALDVQNINLDAWYGLINAYKALGKGDEDFLKLSQRIADALTYYPLPMWKTLEDRIKPEIKSGESLAILALQEQVALKKATKATTANTTQPEVSKTMANSLLGNQNTAIATFSLDGNNAGKIMIDSSYGGGNQVLYSIDGGVNWKNAGITTEVLLTQEEIDALTPEKDLLVRFQGTTNYYTIDITKASTPSNLYRNDRENRLIGSVANLEWRVAGDDQWTDLTSDTTFTGDKTIQVRVKANGTEQVSDIATYKFTTDTDTASKKYIPLSHISYVGTSSQQNEGSSGAKVLTGEPNSMWHTVWSGNDNERYVTVKFDEPRYLTAVDYTPRQTGNNGRFLSCEVYTSMDGEDWMLAGSVTGWGDNANTKRVNLFGPTYAKYVKVVGTKTIGNFGSAAMLEFFEDTTVESKTVESIEVKTAPKKTTYLRGDELNIKGLVVIAHYDDGTKGTLKHKFLQFDKTILDKLGKETISVSYSLNGEVVPVTFDVNVVENTKDITGITVTELPTKMRYFVGDSLDTTGMVVKAQYADGTEGYIFDDMYEVVPGTFKDATDSQKVTIRYTRNDKTVSDSFDGVEVTKTVKSITISKKPTTTTYNLGDDFNNKGMQVSVVYDDNTKEVLDSTDYVIESDGFSNNPGAKTITVTYARKPEIQTSVSVIVFPYIQTEQFIFEAAEGKDTASLTYVMGNTVAEDGKVEVPSTVTVADKLDFTVNTIGRSSFEGQTNVKSVVLPSTVQSIEKDAFKNSTGLKEVYLTSYDNFDNLSIADTAFSGVTGATIYVANEKLVKELEDKNITGIKNLTIKSIAEKVTTLEIQAPNKTEYTLGESADFTGLEVYGILEDGNKILLNSETYSMNAFDRNKAGEQVITVRLNKKDVTASFTLNVTPATPSIEAQPMDMGYNETEKPEALKVVASTKDAGHLSYQWYSNTTNSTKGATAIQGATTDSYVPELKDQYYFVVVTNNDAAKTEGTSISVTSDIAHIQVGSYEARIGNTSYATLKEAVVNAEDGATIQIRKDITIEDTIVINKNLTITGHTIKRANTFNGLLFQVNKGTVLLENVEVDGGAVWTGNEDATLKRGTKNTGIVADNSLVLVTAGELNLGKDAVLKNNANNSNNYGRSGGAVRISGGTFRMTGGTMKDNYSAPYGGAVLATGGSVIIESGLVSGNHGTSSGGTFCIDQSATFTMTSTENPEDTVIENNLGNGNGGAIWLSNGKATLNGGIIRNNKATNGGAVYMQGSGTLELGDVTITGNSVTNMVSGIYYANGSISIIGVPNMENDIYVTGGRQLKLTSDLTNIKSKIRISNIGSSAETAVFVVADTAEHAKSAENAFALATGLSLYADGTNVYFTRKNS